MTVLFKKLDFNEFKLQYKEDIRVNIAWDSLKTVRTTLEMVTFDENEDIVLSHFHKGNWRDGKPIIMRPLFKPALLRLPAVHSRQGFFLLDGTHRFKEIRPKWVVLDVLWPSDKQKVYFTDLFNSEL